MLWFFDRDEQQVEVETRFDNATLEYVLVIRWPDGQTQTERYQDAAAFRIRVVALDDELKALNWRNTESPVLLPGGWNDGHPTH
jgi:hypothetical protein